MEKKPKRRKHKDNPYTTIYLANENKFKVSFKDVKGKKQIVDITEEIFIMFDEFELKDKSEMNEFDRHIEHSEIYEETLNMKIKDKPLEIDEYIIQKFRYEELHIAIKELPEIQKRRLKKYFFEDKTFEEIAKLENCTKRAVKFSVDIALKKLKEILKK